MNNDSLSQEDMETILDVFRTLLQWSQEAEEAKK
jgi:hypothetical protein